MLHTETVEAGALALIRQIMRDQQMKEFYLVGGAALSLVMGHRKSASIDLFSRSQFDVGGLTYHLEQIYKATCIRLYKKGLCCIIRDTKVDILTHDYERMHFCVEEDGIRMESMEDLGAIKLNDIVSRGFRLKDFVDFYFLLEHYPLDYFLKTYVKKYPQFNRMMATAALQYYKDIRPATIQYMGKSITAVDFGRRFADAVRNPRKVFGREMVSEGGTGIGDGEVV